jgi:hypothetical protein
MGAEFASGEPADTETRQLVLRRAAARFVNERTKRRPMIVLVVSRPEGQSSRRAHLGVASGATSRSAAAEGVDPVAKPTARMVRRRRRGLDRNRRLYWSSAMSIRPIKPLRI